MRRSGRVRCGALLTWKQRSNMFSTMASSRPKSSGDIDGASAAPAHQVINHMIVWRARRAAEGHASPARLLPGSLTDNARVSLYCVRSMTSDSDSDQGAPSSSVPAIAASDCAALISMYLSMHFAAMVSWYSFRAHTSNFLSAYRAYSETPHQGDLI